MKRISIFLSAIAMALVVGCGRANERSSEEPWYHTSDVGQLSATDRPQLVEFFHPD